MDNQTASQTTVVIDVIPPWKGLTDLLREKGYSPYKPDSIADGLNRGQEVNRAARERVSVEINPFNVQSERTSDS